MELLLIRHALPVRRELLHGSADPDLAEEGRAQAEHLAAYLASERIDAIYASPLRRARQTAEALAGCFGIDVHIVDGVAEYDRNATHYVPVEELKAANDPRWAAILEGAWHSDESVESFTSRVVDSVESVVDQHPGQRAAVVCHGGVINAYLAYVLGLPAGRNFFYPNYTSIQRVAAARTGQRTIVTVNETSHLRNTGLPIGVIQK